MMNRKRWLVLLGLILGLGMFLRLYQLGSHPSGLTWDEAAIGYNGWSVLTTRRDEWLNRFPISFRSFGDYKAPVAVYLNGPFTYLLGISAFSIRLPFALSACVLLIIWALFLLWLEHRSQLSLPTVVFGVAILAFSPWHVVFSRIGFESGLSLTGLVISVVALLYFFENPRKRWSLALATIAGVWSIYAYHSAKIVVPLLILLILYIWRDQLKKRWKDLVSAASVGLIMLLPLGVDSLLGKGATRSADLWLLSSLPPQEKVQTFMTSIWRNSDPRFLLFGHLEELRHVTGVFGILSLSVLGLAIVSVIAWVMGAWSSSPVFKRRIITLAFGWVIIGFLPSWLSILSPHANRALLALPGILLLAIFFFDLLVEKAKVASTHNRTVIIARVMLTLVIVVELVWFSTFVRDYFSSYRTRISTAFNQGYQEAVAVAKAAEVGAMGANVDQIIFSNRYGQPYMYILLFNQISPIAYHNGALVRYLFPDKVTMGDVTRINALLIYTPEDTEVTVKPDGIIYGSDRAPRFYWYYTDRSQVVAQ